MGCSPWAGAPTWQAGVPPFAKPIFFLLLNPRALILWILAFNKLALSYFLSPRNHRIEHVKALCSKLPHTKQPYVGLY